MGRVRYTVTETSSDPHEQVRQTIGLMRQYANEDAQNPVFLNEVRTATQADPIDDVWNYLSAKDGIRRMQFVQDEQTARPWGDIGRWRPVVEALIRPVDQTVLAQAQGDCDDFSMYGAAMLLARGVPVAYTTVKADPSEPDLYSHVYLSAYPRSGRYQGQRVPLDLSHGWGPGWETRRVYGRKEWPLQESGCGIAGFAGLAIAAWGLYELIGRCN